MDRIAKELPDISLIILLRDPVDRAYSHYLHNVVRGREHLPLEEAIDREDDRLRESDAHGQAVFSYTDRGRYAAQIEHVFSLFPRASVMVELFEDLRDDSRASFCRVADFLGIDSEHIPDAVGQWLSAVSISAGA